MANDSITTVLSVVAWGTKLTFGLYDFAVAHASSPATQDVTRLAKEVNLLSQVLRQVGSRLKDDGSLPSPEAFNVVRAILDQCQDVFREIETLIPLGQPTSRPGSYDSNASTQSAALEPWRKSLEVDWNAVVQSRTQYLLGHLESLKLTMSVMLQTLYTAKAIVWARYDNNQTAYEAVVVEKLQTESLVIEQQLAFFRAYRLHDAFRWYSSQASQQIEQSPQSQALIKRDSEYGPSPRALVPYQEPSLATMQPSPREIEDLPKVRLVSSPYVDSLLRRWTQMHIIEERLRLDQQRPRLEQQSEKYQRRNYQSPAIDSDSDEFDDNIASGARRPPKLNLGTHEPVLMHVDEKDFVSSPKPTSATPRSATLQPPGGIFSPQVPSSWGGTSGTYFPQAGAKSNSSRPRVNASSPRPSPLSSPRVSFSSDQPPPRVQTAFKPNEQPAPPRSSRNSLEVKPAPPRSSSAIPDPTSRRGIPYRLRINQWYWDYLDATLLGSNHNTSPHAAIKLVSKDTQAITEIFQEYVSRDAIRKDGLEYTRVPRKRIIGGDGPGGGGPGGREVEEQCYCIEGALRPEEVNRLVERTRRYRGEHSASSPLPKSPRSVMKAVGLAAPPLDRSNTAPVLGNKFRDTHPKEVERATASLRHREGSSVRSNTTTASNTSDSESNYKTSSKPRTRSKSRRGESRHRQDSPRSSYDRDEDHRGSSSKGRNRSRSRGGGDRERERRKHGSGSGSGKMQTATKIAAGAGLATLLDGLPEMLSYL